MTVVINVKKTGATNTARVKGGWGITASSTNCAAVAVSNAVVKLSARTNRSAAEAALKCAGSSINHETWLVTWPDEEPAR